MSKILTDSQGRVIVGPQGVYNAPTGGTQVLVGGTPVDELNFASDPQEQLNGKASKDVVPTPTSADADKVLKVNASGVYELGTAGGGGGAPIKMKKLWSGSANNIPFSDKIGNYRNLFLKTLTFISNNIGYVAFSFIIPIWDAGFGSCTQTQMINVNGATYLISMSAYYNISNSGKLKIEIDQATHGDSIINLQGSKLNITEIYGLES